MPKMIVPLTEAQVRNAKRRERTYKLFDGQGLFLEVTAVGTKQWRMRFKQVNNKETMLALGPYPEVTLAEARAARVEIRRQLRQGIDPVAQRRQARQALSTTAVNTFGAIAIEWHGVKSKSWSADYAKNVLHRLESDVFPDIGSVAIESITHRALIDIFRKIETRGAHEIAKRNKAIISQIFSYAVQCNVVSRNPIADMKDVLQAVTPGHFAAIGHEELPAFLTALNQNDACMGPVVRIAIRLMLLVFVRTNELIATPWSELPEGVEEWVIPWNRMKMGRRKLKPIKKDHVVPLSRQAKLLIEELRSYTGGGPVLFPNQRDHLRPMSDNAILKALERMGYKGLMTGHGFRALAMSTIKEKLGYRHEVVDLQLAHVKKDKVEQAYDRATFIDERREMMQAWADYIDRL